MDCQGLVVRLLQDFVLLTTAVEVAQRWRELAEKLAKVSKQQMDAYESPHRDRNGVVDSEVSGAARRDAREGGGRPLLPGVGGRETRSDAAKAAPPGAGGDAGSGASLRSGAPHGEGAGGGRASAAGSAPALRPPRWLREVALSFRTPRNPSAARAPECLRRWRRGETAAVRSALARSASFPVTRGGPRRSHCFSGCVLLLKEEPE